MRIKYDNKYISDALAWLACLPEYSEVPDVNVSVLNGYQSVTGDEKSFGFAVYIPKETTGGTACIEIAGDLPDELEDFCEAVENRESAERDFFVGNLFHEFAHHLQWSGFRMVDKSLREDDAEAVVSELFAKYSEDTGNY